jgi:hypothetical protein
VTGELHSESVITFHVVRMCCYVVEELRSMCDGGIVELVLHRRLIVSEKSIKVRVGLSHQDSLLVELGPSPCCCGLR